MTAVIRVIDLETDGVEPPDDRVCEIGFTDIEATQTDLSGAPAGWQIGSKGSVSVLVNPGVPMSPVGSSIHHLTDEDVFRALPWSEVHPMYVHAGAAEIVAYAAHSAKAERQHITDEMTGGKPWVCTYKAALHLWPDCPRHSNQCVRYYLRPPGLNPALAAPAHRAAPDSYVTAHILMMALERVSLAQLIEWTEQPALLPRITFGDLRGQPWSVADDGLLHWVLGKNFSEDVVYTVRHELDRREKERKTDTGKPRYDFGSFADDDDGRPF